MFILSELRDEEEREKLNWFGLFLNCIALLPFDVLFTIFDLVIFVLCLVAEIFNVILFGLYYLGSTKLNKPEFRSLIKRFNFDYSMWWEEKDNIDLYKD